MSRFKLLYVVIFIINLYSTNAQISDKRLCADAECKVPISKAKTLITYTSPDPRMLSFASNVDVTIYSKSAGSRMNLWGAEINGKRGYVPKNMVRENKIFVKNPTVTVDTELMSDAENVQVPLGKNDQVDPNKVQEAFEVIQGTTVYSNLQEPITPSTTASPVQQTTVPEVASNQQQKNEAETVSPSSQPSDPKVNRADHKLKPDTETTDESVVGSMFSKFSDWMGEEKNTESAPEDDEDDDDEDEDEDDEFALEDNEIPSNASQVESADIGKETSPDVTVDSNASKIVDEIPGKSDKVDSEDIVKQNPSETILTTFSAKTDNIVNNSESPGQDTVPVLDQHIATSADSKESALFDQNQIDPVEPKPNAQEPLLASNSSDNAATVAPQLNENVELPNTVIPLVPDVKLSDMILPSAPAPQIEIKQDINSDNIKEETEILDAPVPPEPTSEPEMETWHPELDNLSFEEVTPNPAEQVPEVKAQEVDIGDVVPISPLSVEQNATQQPAEVNSAIDSTDDLNLQTTEKSEEFVPPQSAEINALPEPLAMGENQEQTLLDETSKDSGADAPGIFNQIYTILGSNEVQSIDKQPAASEPATIVTDSDAGNEENFIPPITQLSTDNEAKANNVPLSEGNNDNYCDADPTAKICGENHELRIEEESFGNFLDMSAPNFNSDVFLYLITTAVSVIIFLFGYIAFDKSKREGPLVAQINKLEKELLIVLKENQVLQEQGGIESHDRVQVNSLSEMIEEMRLELEDAYGVKAALEDQVQSLEKELENSTEVGMELNRMLSEILSSQNGSDVIKSNVENLQRQLVEQHSKMNSINETLALTNTENHELKLEIDLNNKKVIDLQAELDKMYLNVMKIEEEKEQQQATLENELVTYKQKLQDVESQLRRKEGELTSEATVLSSQLNQTKRSLELKTKELTILKDNVKELNSLKNNEKMLQSLLEVSELQAELQLLKSENEKYADRIQLEIDAKTMFERRAQAAIEEAQQLQDKYDEADKLKLENQTKLEVLSNYFKEREAQLQKEISKHESIWVEKQGEATSTTERIKFMQEQLQNYKAQNESLKQEILSQEVELKSQITVLEKKAHENWVSARQAERKLEDAKQEAAQLRHRLTLRERTLQDEKGSNRIQSPIEQNGDIPVSPLHVDSPASPPLLFGVRDHITKSPPLSGLPPFLPPPPGVPFMPPPPGLHGVPPFMTSPPSLYPGDHRPPPLGRMSSPPINSRYSPSSRGYSPYDRNSSSPSDSEYGTSPPHPRRGYSPYNNRMDDRRDERRDYKRPPPGRTIRRNVKGGGSSGSGHSNESLEKINRQQSKV